MAVKVINNYQEYKEFLTELEPNFGCIEYWENFFGFELKYNEETGETLETLNEYQGNIRVCPEDFPAIISYIFSTEGSYRHGDLTIQYFDWITMSEINKQLKK